MERVIPLDVIHVPIGHHHIVKIHTKQLCRKCAPICVGYAHQVSYVWDMCGLCVGNVWVMPSRLVMCGICVGYAQQVSYVWDMCGLCPAD